MRNATRNDNEKSERTKTVIPRGKSIKELRKEVNSKSLLPLPKFERTISLFMLDQTKREEMKNTRDELPEVVVEYPFAPSINPKSRRLAEGTQDQEVTKRLETWQEKRDLKVKKATQETRDFEEEKLRFDMTFKPKTNNNPRYQVSSRVAENVNQAFTRSFYEQGKNVPRSVHDTHKNNQSMISKQTKTATTLSSKSPNTSRSAYSDTKSLFRPGRNF